MDIILMKKHYFLKDTLYLESGDAASTDLCTSIDL